MYLLTRKVPMSNFRVNKSKFRDTMSNFRGRFQQKKKKKIAIDRRLVEAFVVEIANDR